MIQSIEGTQISDPADFNFITVFDDTSQPREIETFAPFDCMLDGIII